MTAALADHNTTPENPLIFAHLFDGKGGARELDWDDIKSGPPSEGKFWLHMDRTHPDCRNWMERNLGLTRWLLDGLFDEDTRPRCTATQGGLLLNLRGANLNEGANPTDMLAVRFWITERGVISLRRYPLRSLRLMHDHLLAGTGPTGPGSLLAAIADKLMELMDPVIRGLNEALDDAELELVSDPRAGITREVAEARAGIIALRRYLRPQAEALTDLIASGYKEFEHQDLSLLSHARQDVLRYVEDLEEMRERAIFVYEEFQKRQNDRMNETIYRLTIITVVFLPLGFLTGLLGINVGGMPGANSDDAFWIVTAGLVVIGFAVYGLFKAIGFLDRPDS